MLRRLLELKDRQSRRFGEEPGAFLVVQFGGVVALADELDGKGSKRRSGLQNRPIAGTRLIREWRGVEHSVTVRQEDFEYKGQPYKSLSAIALAPSRS